ncbi:MAG: hypothetical protein ABEJ31_01485 [Haloarculaceae archaeon]
MAGTPTDGTAEGGDGGVDDATDDADAGDRTYGGLFRAFPYAVRASESWLFRVYAVLAAVLSLALVVLFGGSLIVQLGATASVQGGVFTFSRAFVIFVGLLVVGPLLAPVLAVARRHRRVGSTARYDAALATTGYLFVLALYLTLVLSVPPDLQEPARGPAAPLVRTLYALPAVTGFVPPVVAAAVMYLVHRRLR